MDIIVNDTNIFIDLHSVGLLGALCELPYDVRTVDFVVAEIINPEQSKAISNLIIEGKIKVESLDPDEIDEIITEHSNAPGNISIPDCSVCYYARKHSATLQPETVSFADTPKQVMCLYEEFYSFSMN